MLNESFLIPSHTVPNPVLGRLNLKNKQGFSYCDHAWGMQIEVAAYFPCLPLQRQKQKQKISFSTHTYALWAYGFKNSSFSILAYM